MKATVRLLLETELLHQSTVCALVVDFQVLQMLAAVGNEPQKTATAVRILAIFIQMNRKLLDSTGQNGHLHLRGARIGVVTARFAYFVLLFTLRKHCGTVSRSRAKCKGFDPSCMRNGALLRPLLSRGGRGSRHHFYQLNAENKRRIRRDNDFSGHRVFYVFSTVAEARRDSEETFPAHLHAPHTYLEARDNLRRAE